MSVLTLYNSFVNGIICNQFCKVIKQIKKVSGVNKICDNRYKNLIFESIEN